VDDGLMTALDFKNWRLQVLYGIIVMFPVVPERATEIKRATVFNFRFTRFLRLHHTKAGYMT
jgi:hypothetical protein